MPSLVPVEICAMRVFHEVAHPWHGIHPGEQAPELVTAYIEIVPLDTVKFELDKTTGHLIIDRPQQYSSLCPTPYGFIPRTYCGDGIAALARGKNKKIEKGDGDPLDICVLAEATITRSDILLRARPIGGLRLIDRGEADDKIIAVMRGDALFDACTDIKHIPETLLDRLRHYFLTYKQIPGAGPRAVEIAEIYGVETAHEVIRVAMNDYRVSYT